MNDSLNEDQPSSRIDEERQRQILPVRLQRSMPWGTQIGCSFVFGLAFTAIAAGCIYGIRHDDSMDGGTRIFVWAALIVFGLLGPLMLFSAVHQLFARRIRETIVEIEHTPILLGEPVQFCVRQEGRVQLSSLRMVLSCFEVTTRRNPNSSGGGPSTTTTERSIFDTTVLDVSNITIAAEMIEDFEGTFTVPADQPTSHSEGEKSWRWQLDVWGKVLFWPDFQHPFGIYVTTEAELAALQLLEEQDDEA
ncbi:MAG: hypothetical protein KDA85_13965 [Planctomycetaceae bacterium]|nr:hypothetical protein [Planctomycetaceae bacterium]